MTNRLARGSPDVAFTEKSGPGMIVGIIDRGGLYRPRYLIRWLKSGQELEFHADSLMRVTEASK